MSWYNIDLVYLGYKNLEGLVFRIRGLARNMVIRIELDNFENDKL